MFLAWVLTLPQLSVNVHDSTTVPPQYPAGDCAPSVEIADPEMRQPPLRPFEKLSELVVAAPHPTVIAGAATN